MSKRIGLRPHHAMCIQHFVGKGYSEEFIRNMHSTIYSLETNNPIVKLVSRSDSICGECPNCIDGNCVDETKIKLLDESMLSKCNLVIGQELTWQDFKKSVRKNIIDENLLHVVCNSCEWVSLCEKVKI